MSFACGTYFWVFFWVLLRAPVTAVVYLMESAELLPDHTAFYVFGFELTAGVFYYWVEVTVGTTALKRRVEKLEQILGQHVTCHFV